MINQSSESIAIDNYEIHEEIGRGQYGSVRRVYDKQREVFFAMKIIETDKRIGIPPSILKEVGILRELDHANIVRLQDVIFFQNKICILYELAAGDLNR